MDIKVLLFVFVYISVAESVNTPPVFTNLPATQPVLENTPPNNVIIFKCSATDVDSSTANGTIAYTFSSGNKDGRFSLNGQTGEVLLVQALDYEFTTSYNLDVKVTDGGGLSAISTLTITVTDVDDSPPICPKKVYSGYVYENVPIHTPFATLNCTDPNKILTYHVFVGPSSRADTIEVTTTGDVRTNRSIDRDIETPPVFPAVVQVMNGGYSVEVTVYLTVLDIDDNNPKFNQPAYTANVDENAAVGTPVVTITASDIDEANTPNSLIQFGISCNPDKLKIDVNNGHVFVSDEIDYEMYMKIICTVTAHSLSSNTSTATLTVDVKNMNDNPPQFAQSFSSFPAYENQTFGAPVYVDRANDTDGDKVTYSIANPNLFDVNPNTGAIFVNKALDYETEQSCLLMLIATDNGNPPMSSTTYIQALIDPVNEFPPVFDGSCTGNVSEDATRGVYVTAVNATDMDLGDDGVVSYSIVGSTPFTVDPKSGVITVEGILDYELKSAYTFLVQATDNSTTLTRSATTTCSITVIDVDDDFWTCQHPGIVVVQYSQYSFPINNKITQINCSPNRSTYPALFYTITNDPNGTFEIINTTGVVILKMKPTSPKYELSIEVTSGANSYTTTLPVVAETQLKLTNLPANILQPEEVANNDLFIVTVDYAFSNVKFSILSGNENNIVSIASPSGKLRLMVPLDREKQTVYTFNIQATSDSQQTATGTLTVNLIDINDNSPEFPSEVIEFAIEETYPVKTPIALPTAVDPDEGLNGQLMYSIYSGNTNSVFDIDQNTGTLELNGSLEYAKVNNYTLIISAKDKGISPRQGSLVVIILVQNRNLNPPQLVNMTGNYTKDIYENATLGSSVFKLLATEKGTSYILTYAIVSGNTNNAFLMDPASGVVLLVQILDRETTPVYTLNISATDQNGASVSATLNINVLDVNDNSPFCNPVVTIFYVPDLMPAMQTLIPPINVTDLDQGMNANVSLTIVDPKSPFQIIGASSLQPQIQMNYAMNNRYMLTILAVDNGTPSRSGTCVCIIQVLSGEIPGFNKSSDSVTVSEDLIQGSKIYDANATAKGAYENGSIEYRISSNINNDFSIDPRNGIVVNQNTLNFTRYSIYLLTITAVNKDTPAKSASMTLTVNVTNVNGEDPIFYQSSYSAPVDELAKLLTSVTTIFAYDPDGVIYNMSGSTAFKIDSIRGIITSAEILDYQITPTYLYTVYATDKVKPYRYSSASLVITVTDGNNHAPVVTSGTVLNIFDKVPVGTPVFHVQATDADTNESGLLSYEITDLGYKDLSLDKKTGIMTVAVNLTGPGVANLTLTVLVSDAGKPSLNTTTKILVTILPAFVNNNPPVFNNCSSPLSVNRNSAVGTTVASFAATDQDQGPSLPLTYFILSGNDGAYFILNKGSGILTTATSLVMASSSFTLVVLVIDHGYPSRNATCNVAIYINPSITYNLTFNASFTIPENSLKNTLVGTISGNDGRTISAFTISDGNYNNTFAIKQSGNDGQLVINNPPDSEKYSLYSLRVTATSDAGDLTYGIKVNISDMDDNCPVISPSPLSFSVPEHSLVGTTFASISVTDLDIDVSHQTKAIVIQPLGQTLFSLDSSLNLVLIAVPDFETISPKPFTFTITASDTVCTVTLSVTVTIIDVPETVTSSTSEMTNSSMISLECPIQASVGDPVYTVVPGDFGLFPNDSAISVQYSFFKTSIPISVNAYTGVMSVSGKLTNNMRYTFWVSLQAVYTSSTVIKTVMFRIDTFDMQASGVVLVLNEAYGDVISSLPQHKMRVQNFFHPNQRVGFSKVVRTSTTSRRRLLAESTAIYMHVIADRSADLITNINEPKTFMTQSAILNVIQQNPDGAPVTGLSGSSMPVQSVEPFVSNTNDEDFEDSPGGIAVFVLIGLLFLALIILIIACIWYRENSKIKKKSKKPKKKDAVKKENFSTLSNNQINFNSNPHVIVSAPPPVTLQATDAPSSPPVKPQNDNYFTELKQPNAQNERSSQQEAKDGDRNTPSKHKNVQGKSKKSKISVVKQNTSGKNI